METDQHFETIYGRLHARADQLTTTNVVSEDKGWGINRTKVYIYSGLVLGITILLYMWSPSVLKHSETNTTNWGRLFFAVTLIVLSLAGGYYYWTKQSPITLLK